MPPQPILMTAPSPSGSVTLARRSSRMELNWLQRLTWSIFGAVDARLSASIPCFLA